MQCHQIADLLYQLQYHIVQSNHYCIFQYPQQSDDKDGKKKSLHVCFEKKLVFKTYSYNVRFYVQKEE